MTIYALSTGPGVSGLAVMNIWKRYRVTINKITGKSLPKPRKAVTENLTKSTIIR